jgi:Fe-S-cluster containining protein
VIPHPNEIERWREYNDSLRSVTSRMLGMKLSRERLTAATTAAFDRTAGELGRSCDSAACASLCRSLNGTVDREWAAFTSEGAAIACAPGCDYCCHLRVEVFQHEAAALLEHVRTRAQPADAAAIERRILANAERVDAMTAEQHRSAGMACAFLIAGRCAAHDVRPSACAAYHSLSRERCEQSFHRPQDIGTTRNSRPVLLELQVFGSALIEATQAGRRQAGLAGEQQELHQALRALLARDSSA